MLVLVVATAVVDGGIGFLPFDPHSALREPASILQEQYRGEDNERLFHNDTAAGVVVISAATFWFSLFLLPLLKLCSEGPAMLRVQRQKCESDQSRAGRATTKITGQ